MLFAIVNGEKCEATPQSSGRCPLCQEKVFSKCGDIKNWHWAHHNSKSCDSWYEPETEWHKNWKLIFGKDNCEIVISKDGVRHIADIVTKKSVVIELQNSPIQKNIIRRRENFYGERMIWVVNGIQFKDNFWIYSSNFDYEKNYIRTLHGIVDIATGEIVSSSNYEVTFSWSWARQSWNDVQRPVFIDFGDENLFWVKSGMGTRSGSGIQISKEDFIKKYEGDVSLLSSIIEKKQASPTAAGKTCRTLS